MTDESCHVENTTHRNNDESNNISMHDLSIKQKICSIKLLSTYIDCLIDNIPKENIPIEIAEKWDLYGLHTKSKNYQIFTYSYDDRLYEEFGKAIGADAYCRDAAVAVETAKEFVARKHNQLSA